jgi:TRAP-type mannitol/chloroaromatic compound transport system substrate-binding protein
MSRIPWLVVIAAALVALVGGAAVGRYILTPARVVVVEQPKSPTEPPRPRPQDTVFLRWKVASGYAIDLPQYGTLGRKFADRLKRATAGGIAIELEEPGKSVPADKCLEELGRGRVDACWSSPLLWTSREPALALFAGAPFGPQPQEFLAWLAYGGGQELLDEVYSRHGAKSIPCGVVAANAGGWFRKEIASPDDLKGLKLRAFGLAARVYGRVGARPQHLDGQQMLDALKSGEIDAAEYSMPAVDVGLGFHTLVSNYYFPGWQRPMTLLELLVSRRAWDQLPDGTRAMIDIACGDSIREGLTEGEAIQAAALRELRARGAQFRTWPKPVLEALQKAWEEVVNEESAADPNFRRVWNAIAAFRGEYEVWRKLSLPPM